MSSSSHRTGLEQPSVVTSCRRALAVFASATILLVACGKSASDKTATTTIAPAGGTTPAAGATTVSPTSNTTAGGGSTPGTSVSELAVTTPAGKNPVDTVTWSLYREVSSLDPIFSFDYPENTVLAQLCETLVRQAPDGSIKSALADLSQPDDKTLVFTLRDGVTFWNGDPVTADDVVFSLGRARDATLGGFYAAVFSRVDSITATSTTVVTVTLTQPDNWLVGELASTPGWIVQQKFVEAAGADFGNPTGKTMCSGSFKVGDWSVGEKLSIVRNDTYWDSTVKPLVAQIDFVPVADAATLTTGLLAGDIDGSYQFGAVPTIDQLKGSSKISVIEGAGWNTEALIISSFTGAFGKKEIRQALSLALDRQAYIDAVYKGTATLPKSLSAPGTWGYGRDIFVAGYDALPPMTQDLEQAKRLADGAGAAGQTITIGFVSESESQQAQANAYKTAAEAIGLKVVLKGVSADQYINFFIDAEFRKGVDGFFTVNYGDFADPAALLSTLVLPEGSQNYTGYENPEVTSLLEAARTTSDPNERASKVVAAQALIVDDMPWIPTAFPSNTVVTDSGLSGAVASFAYMFAPWANDLGGL